MINVGKKLVTYNIRGFLAGQAIFFLLNFNLAQRQIWITRHGTILCDQVDGSGETTDNVLHKLGGSILSCLAHANMSDASLTEKGSKYAKALAKFVDCSQPFAQRANECSPEAGVSQTRAREVLRREICSTLVQNTRRSRTFYPCRYVLHLVSLTIVQIPCLLRRVSVYASSWTGS
jgi:hypothetical protein